eukprot:g6270.t1
MVYNAKNVENAHNYNDEMTWMKNTVSGDALRDSTAGFDALIPTNWTSLNSLFENVLEAMENVSDYRSSEMRRWVAQDPRVMAMSASDYLMYAAEKEIELITKNIVETIQSVVKNGDSLQNNLYSKVFNDKSILNAIKGVKKGVVSQVNESLYGILKGAENEVYNDWVGFPFPYINDTCGKIPYPSDQSSCVARKYHDDFDNTQNDCVWSSATSKCGFFEYDLNTIKTDLDSDSNFFEELKMALETKLFNLEGVSTDTMLNIADAVSKDVESGFDVLEYNLGKMQLETITRLFEQSLDNKVVTVVTAFNSVQLFAQKVAATMTSGMNKVRM